MCMCTLTYLSLSHTHFARVACALGLTFNVSVSAGLSDTVFIAGFTVAEISMAAEAAVRTTLRALTQANGTAALIGQAVVGVVVGTVLPTIDESTQAVLLPLNATISTGTDVVLALVSVVRPCPHTHRHRHTVTGTQAQRHTNTDTVAQAHRHTGAYTQALAHTQAHTGRHRHSYTLTRTLSLSLCLCVWAT
jgi:hypothetical protein